MPGFKDIESNNNIARAAAALALLTALAMVVLLASLTGTTRATTDSGGDQYQQHQDPAAAGESTTQPAAPAVEESAAAVPAAPAGAVTSPVAPAKTTAAPAAGSPAAGRSGATVASSDTTPPAVSGLSPANGSFTSPTPVISYNYSDPSGAFWPDGVHLYIDNRCSRTLPGSTDITAARLTYTPAAPLAEGSHTLKAFICDNLFNCGTTLWYITVDASAPRLTATYPTGTLSSGDTLIGAAFHDGSGSGASAAGVRVSLDGADITGSCNVDAAGVACPVNGLGDGTHQVALTVPDQVGNSAAGSWSFTVDTQAVGITGQQPAPGSWQSRARPVIGAAFQPAASGQVDPGSLVVLLDGADVTHLAVADADGFSLTPSVPLVDGFHVIQAFVADDAGHSGVSEWQFGSDTAAPGVTTTAPRGTTGPRPTLSASFADARSGIDTSATRLYLDGRDITAASTPAAARITFVPHHELAAGNHSVRLDLADLAGNRRSISWSFSVAAAAAADDENGDAAAGQTPTAVPAMTTQTFFTFFYSPGRWSLTGFVARPGTYLFPWFDPQAIPGASAELIIENRGAGEAFASMFLAGKESWSGKIPEGGAVTVSPAGAGPIKVICPTGQQLETTLRLRGDGWETQMAGSGNRSLATTWVLPWYEGNQQGMSNTIAIANAGSAAAEVDVYIGDSLLPESHRGRFIIEPDASALAEFPGVSGGMVKIVSANGQPLLVGQLSRFGGALSLTPAAAVRQLASRYTMAPESLPGSGRLLLAVGNPNSDDIEFRVSVGGRSVSDGDSEVFRLAPEQARLVPLDPAGGEPVVIDCEGCGFGRGVVVGWRAEQHDHPFEHIIIPGSAPRLD